ncbi:group III truncated hemoglobin [Brumimicrobium mesophilum]|uniref:group III truncated hemoglobin n=1 Tax=Brumimicrobium mesophilum TaxID=392717 RepID=UPI000D13F628|nr:group III truncated hemoglobin [Brumimicrobium mesophilum]
MREIENREDVSELVNDFYAKIRTDETLGPIFNSHLSDEQWPSHLEKLTDFWETNLFGIPKFKGNPPHVHAEVDRNLNYGVTQEHFAHWMHIWFRTIDEKFEGRLADRAKNAARKMSTGLYIAIWHQRPGNKL